MSHCGIDTVTPMQPIAAQRLSNQHGDLCLLVFCEADTEMWRQAVGGLLPPGPFDGSPVLCYAQKPLCAATVPDSMMDIVECGYPMGQNMIIAVCPFGRCNQVCGRGCVT